ncbi:hypothetical protein WMF11_12160 [Sorangium sp. So ce295]|uniref:hypothetical protein n=1 Tax=Sorangium sp. So ce295 TaxID=3133295 RepID=UPI003F641388
MLAPAERQIDLILDLLRPLPAPFGVLHVLLVSRCGNAAARRQEPAPMQLRDVAGFLREFEEFFERDGRHHVWVTSLPSQSTIVYDNHNLVYAYGPLEQFIGRAEARGLARRAIEIPVPHHHCFNLEYDDAEAALLDRFDWLEFPLQPGDDP